MSISRKGRSFGRSPFLLRRLEDRILFDAALDPALSADELDASGEASNFDGPLSGFVEDVELADTSDSQSTSSQASQSSSHELVVVDTSVENYQQLVDDLVGNENASRSFEIVLLDAETDGIEQLTELLSQRIGLDAIHLISHGEEGALRIGTDWLTNETLSGHAGDLAAWGSALSVDGDLLVYGCDLAGSDAGRELASSLSALTGADVAASEDDTGAADRGGDWDLEYTAGSIEATVAFSSAAQASYAGVLAAGPSVAIDATATAQISEDFTFDVTFDNTGDQTGFGPFIDLIFPVNGKDGAAGTDIADGIDFKNATYLGQTLNVIEVEFPTGGAATVTIDHPYAKDVAGNPLQVTGTAGDKLYVVELPFGSVTKDQPDITVQITASVSPLADLDSDPALQDLVIQARSGFRYGHDELDNPTSDPSLVSDAGTDVTDVTNPATSWSQQLTVTPTLILLDKTYLGPEDETATGPNHVQHYRIEVDVADGQTIANLDIIDTLPSNIVVTSIDSVTVGGAAAAYTDNLASLTMPGNAQELTVTLTNDVVGGTTADDVVVTFSFYVTEFDADANRVIPISGEDDTVAAPDSRSHNNARAVGDWVPVDVRDAGGIDNAVADPAGTEHILDDKAIAIQKSVSIFNDTGTLGATPGDTLEYALTFQISDYYTFGDLVITDTFQDGQRFDFTYGATFDITDVSGNVTGTFSVRQVTDADGGERLVVDETQIDLTDNGAEDGVTPDGSDGSTSLIFDVSGMMRDADLSEDGVLQGGLSIDGNDAINQGAATGTIRFRTVIQEDYSDTFDSGDRSVDQGDVITNSTLQISGTVRENAEANGLTGDITQVIGNEQDTSSASIAIQSGTLTKEVYAINGNTTLPMGANGLPVLVAGDLVTYRIRYTLPTSDFEDLRLTDFLPLPIFDADDHNADGVGGDTWSFNIGGSFDAAAPASGVIEFGAGDTFYNSDAPASNITPTVTVNDSNGVELFFGDYDDPTSVGDTIEFYLSVTAQAAPTADGLFLTNIVRVSEGTTQQTPTIIDRIIQIEVTQPELSIQKGIVSSDSASATFNTGVGPAGITFTTAGMVGAPFFGGTIHSDGLAAQGINANITGGIDAGDTLRYAIVIENTGNSAAGAFDVQLSDALPTGMSFVAGSLQVVDGTGATVGFTDVNGGNPGLFGDGIELTDPGATTAQPDGTDAGAVDGYNATSGRNVVIVFYDLVADATVTPNELLVNTATLTNYAGQEGGEDHTPTDLTHSASARIENFDATKTIVTTSESHTGFESGIERVTIGEIARYRVTVELPEGSVTNMQIRDLLPTGLTFIDDGNATVAFVSDSGSIASTTLSGAGLDSTSSAVTPTFVLPDDAISASSSSNNDSFDPGNDVNFKLGDITNAESDANAEYVIVEFNALVNNNSIDAANQNDAGDVLYNDVQVRSGATLIYDMPNGNRPAIAIVEPLINNVNKTADVISGDAGDTVTYTITFTPASGIDSADAFNVRLLDTLPTDMTFGAITSITVGGVAATPTNNSAGNTLDLTFDRINEGQSVVVTYTATLDVAVNPEQQLDNTANVTYSSLPGDFGTSDGAAGNATDSDLITLNGLDTDNSVGESGSVVYDTTSGSLSGERNGSDGAAGEPNDYADSESHRVTVDAVTNFTKSLISTEFVNGGNANDEAVIGELVTYELVLTVPEGTIPGVTIVDSLDGGLAYVGMVANSDTDVSYTGSATPVLTDNGRTVTWNLGDVTDTNVGNNTDGTITLRYQAVVLNVSGNQDSTDLDNSATFTWGGNNATAITVDAEGVTVIEPIVDITNTVMVGGNVGQTTGDAGDAVQYTIVIENTTGIDAFDVLFEDVLPTVSGGSSAILGATFTVNDSASVLTASDFTLAGNDGAGYTLSLNGASDLDLLNADGARTITLTVSGTIASSVGPNDTITNTPTIQWTSLDGTVGSRSAATTDDDGERDGNNLAFNTADYGASDPESVTINPPTFTKSLFGTDQTETSGSEVTIGENVTYALLVSMPEGSADGLVVVDALPDGLNFSSFVVVTDAASSGGLLSNDFAGTVNAPVVSGGAADGDDVTFTFGAVTTTVDNDSTNNAFVILVTATVSDVATSVGYGVGQTTLTNTATLDVVGDAVGAVTSNGVDVDVVESNLVITKNIVDALANAGDTMTVELTITNNGEGAAYDVIVVDDLIDADYDLASVTIGASGTDYPADFTAAYNSTNGRVVYSGGTIAAGGSVTFSFTADLADTVATDAILVNTATIDQATTLSGTVAGERDDTDPDGDNSDTDNDSVRIRGHSLAGFVYFDADNDGVKDVGEVGIENVDVRLQGTDHLSNAVDITIQTLADGSYVFSDLRPGTYSITETQPLVAPSGKDYLDGIDTVGTPVSDDSANDAFTNIVLPLTSEIDGTNNNFGELEEAEISGFVWHDANNDGVKDGGEIGIGGVTVKLTGSNDLGPVAEQTVTTLADGSYSFDELRPGTYTLTQTQPTFNAPSGRAYADGIDVDGSLNNGDVTSNDVNSSIELVAANTASSYNFGEVVQSIVSGYVFHDTGNDGLRAGDTGIGGVTVTLSGTDDLGNLVSLSTTTSTPVGTLGYYEFSNLRPSDATGYTITQTTPAGFLDGIDTVGNQGGTLANDVFTAIVIASDTNGTENNFGEILPSSLSGLVFHDRDNNGLFDGADTPIEDAFVRLTGTDDVGGSVDILIQTLADGTYGFMNLRPSDAAGYTITETQPTLYNDGIHSDGALANGDNSVANVISSINLLQDQDGTAYNFAERGISISGAVFIDHEGDGGDFDAGDGDRGIEGVLVSLDIDDDADNIFDRTITTVTDANGQYEFLHLIAGDHRVRVDTSYFSPHVSITSTFNDDGVIDDETTLVLVADDNDRNAGFGYPGLVDYAVTNVSSLTGAAQGGDTYTYEVIVTNVGERDGTGVLVVDTFPMDIFLPDGLVHDHGAAATWDFAAGTLTWGVGDLDVGQSQTMIVTVTIPFVPPNVLDDEIITTAIVSDDGLNGLETRYDNNIAPTLDELTLFAFDAFTNQGNWDQEDILGILPAATLPPDRMARPLPVDPIFSGIAEPGTTLVLRIYDESGRLLGDRQVVADVGGNWLATFPGTVIWKHPHRMEIEQVASIENANEDAGFNLRRYFHPASHHSLFMTERPTVSGVIRETASETIEAIHEAHNNPLHLGLKAHLYQLNTASSNAAQK